MQFLSVPSIRQRIFLTQCLNPRYMQQTYLHQRLVLSALRSSRSRGERPHSRAANAFPPKTRAYSSAPAPESTFARNNLLISWAGVFASAHSPLTTKRCFVEVRHRTGPMACFANVESAARFQCKFTNQGLLCKFRTLAFGELAGLLIRACLL